MNFTEHTQLETGFAEVFDREVGPKLASIEGDRVEKLKKAKLYAPLTAVVGIGLAVLLFSYASGWVLQFIGFFCGVGGVFGGLGVWSSYSSAWAGELEQAVMPAICTHVGDLKFSRQSSGTFPVESFSDLGIVGSYNQVSVKNQLSGVHHSTGFEIVEAHLQKKTEGGSDESSSTDTVFQGLLFRISVPVPAPSPILIARDFGTLGNKFSSMFKFGKGRGMPRVEVPHEAFEAAFEVHAEDPEQALAYMPTPFLDSLLEIAAHEGDKGTKSMMAGFEGNAFYLALSQTKGFMEMGGLTTPVTDLEDDLHGIFDDIELAHRVIDRLHGV